MEYKVIYVRYMSGPIQKQFAFISDMSGGASVSYMDGIVNKNMQQPEISVETYGSLEEAIKDAESRCFYTCSCGGIYIQDPSSGAWVSLLEVLGLPVQKGA